MKTSHLIPVIAVMLFTAVVYVWSQKEGVHDFSGKCDNCHLNTPEKGKEKLLFVKDISFLCQECHREEKGLTHPVDIKPSMEIPSDFILDWKGEITCVTCHYAHKNNARSIRYFLRTAAEGEIFCRMCHSLSIEDELALHKSTVETAHVGSRYTVEDRGDFIDELSMKCINCHDGGIAAEASYELESKIGRGGFVHGPRVSVSHPIGVDYLEAGPAYKPLESLRPEIKLFNGKVGCGSCHNPYSKRHFQLVISNEYSALCFECHIK